MTTITKTRGTFFNDADLLKMHPHCRPGACEYSVYQGILIRSGEGRLNVVFDLIDQMMDEVKAKLLVIQKHEGSVSFIWKDEIPDGYKGGDVEVDMSTPEEPNVGDVWTIQSSIAV